MPPQVRRYYQRWLVDGGTATLTAGDTPFALERGTAWLVPPHVTRSLRPPRSGESLALLHLAVCFPRAGRRGASRLGLAPTAAAVGLRTLVRRRAGCKEDLRVKPTELNRETQSLWQQVGTGQLSVNDALAQMEQTGNRVLTQ